MTVRPCSTIVTNKVDHLPYITGKTTPQEFDRQWQKEVGDTVPLSSYDFGSHALCQASMMNNVQLIQHIYDRDNSVLDLGDTSGWTPLFHAVRQDRFEAVQLLLFLGADPHLSTIKVMTIGGTFNSTRIDPGSTCMWAAVHIIHNVAIAKLLIKRGVTQEPKGDTLGIVKHAKQQIAIEQQIASAFEGVLSGSDQQTIAEYAFDVVPQPEKTPAVEIGIAFDPSMTSVDFEAFVSDIDQLLETDALRQLERDLFTSEST